MPGLKFRVLLDSEKKEEVVRDILISDMDNFESLYNAILKSPLTSEAGIISLESPNTDE